MDYLHPSALDYQGLGLVTVVPDSYCVTAEDIYMQKLGPLFNDNNHGR
jgi:hypothetical protein